VYACIYVLYMHSMRDLTLEAQAVHYVKWAEFSTNHLLSIAASGNGYY